MGRLFDTSPDNIGLHIKNILAEGELAACSATEDFPVAAADGKHYRVKHYSLDAIIAVGYRVNSKRATAFRRWATGVLRDFVLRGYVTDRKRMENGAFLCEDYFDRLLEEIRMIRLSERRFRQRITDIYATAMDYDKSAPMTGEVFAKVLNKTRPAAYGHAAAVPVCEGAGFEKEPMGLTTRAGGPSGGMVKSDAGVAGNHPKEKEIGGLGLIVNAYLDLAESRAKRRIPMTMDDWAKRLDIFLSADDREVLSDPGKIAAMIANDHAESEFEKCGVVQDRQFRSDYDRFLELEEQAADGGGKGAGDEG
jgi:hypothetical protein